MPAGVLMRGAGALPSVGSSDLADADIPLPTSLALALVFRGLVARYGALTTPTPAALSRLALSVPLHGHAVFEKIHVIPRRRELGAVVSEQQITVEVWNAFLLRAKTLTDLTIEGPAGIEVDNPPRLPTHFPASESVVYTLDVLQEGDPLIDNLITWVFTGVDSSGTNIRILGYRLIPFPFPPNLAQTIVETFGYLTDILVSFRGMEQRIQLRAVPVGTIGYSALLDELRDAQMANAILFGNQARSFGVARWQFRGPLLEDATVDDLAVFCDTEDIPFEPRGLVLLWADPYHWEVQTIDSVLADRILLTLGLRNSWTAGATSVLPLVVGRLSPDEAFGWESLAIGSAALVFDIDGFRP